jgi:enoyl-CoA hydratase/carnithine racemase
MQEETVVLYEVKDRVAVVTLNRPEQMNAVTPPMRYQLADVMARAANDPEARVIVLTGAGRAFSAGIDMNYLKGRSAGATKQATQPDDPAFLPSPATGLGPDFGDQFTDIQRFAYFMRIGKPVIAAINGPVLGISCVMALCADIRFGSDKMMFMTAMSQRGLIAEHAIQWLMTRLLGPARTLDLLLSSRKVSGAEAKAIGLVNDTFPHDIFMEEVMAYARTLAQNVSPRSMAVIKAQVWQSMFQSYRESLAVSDHEVGLAFASPDFKEGISHFVEKRPANFPDLKVSGK